MQDSLSGLFKVSYSWPGSTNIPVNTSLELFSINIPSITGFYKLTVYSEDIAGNSGSEIFDIIVVQSPTITETSSIFIQFLFLILFLTLIVLFFIRSNNKYVQQIKYKIRVNSLLSKRKKLEFNSKSLTEYSRSLKFNDPSNLRIIYHKLIVGIDNYQSTVELPPDQITNHNLRDLQIIGNILPDDISSEMKSGLRGRTLLILVELAYQYPENSYLAFIASNLDISKQTASREIKQLENLGYIEQDITFDNLVDNRFKYFKLTQKGVLFLHLLKETLSVTIMGMK